ncbi:MFS transporter [Actinomadura sp. 6K520]|uniref:MFS transporter n=1 Tax=Actinomadura sp. 6K520 TaxID=2530364 RepID=UPI001042B526|nr:MFS transporter [Actinomadura sp. 6K520]TDE27643.1 MFS transporter [Actinomadura sp. 6K520]
MKGSMSRTAFDRRLVAPMVLGSMLNPVNSSIIAVSLVPIGRALDVSPTRTAWLVSGLYLATAVGQPVVGRLVDVLGPRRLYLAGSALVGLAGLLGLVAQDLGTLVAARVLLGIGTCASYPSSMYLIRSEALRTGRASPAGILTLLSVTNQTFAVLGPPVGGLLIGVAGWRSTFAVNIPLSLACLGVGAWLLPRHDRIGGGPRPRFDPLGAALFGVFLVCAMLVLLERDVGLWPLLVVAAVAGVAFVYVELRVAEPFIDLRLLLGNAPLVATYARNLLTATVTYLFLFGYTQWLQEGRGLDPGQAGLLIIPTFLVAIAVAAATGRRQSVRGKLIVGSAVQVTICSALVVIGEDVPVIALVVIAVLVGVPQGLLNLANQNALYHQAEPDRLASSAGLQSMSMYLGALVAAATVGAVLDDGATTSGMHILGLCALVFAGLALVLAVADRGLGRVGEVHRGEAVAAAVVVRSKSDP